MRVSGIVSALSAEVELMLLLPSGQPHQLLCLIDTGFLGALALPEATIEALSAETIPETLIRVSAPRPPQKPSCSPPA